MSFFQTPRRHRPVATPLLVGEAFSPWTIKARWALEYCGIRYDYREYTPTLSEPWLRWRIRDWRSPLSVPVLMVRTEVIFGSRQIAVFAARNSEGQTLGDLAAAQAWDAISERGLADARTRVVRAISMDAAALDESVRFLPPQLRFVLRPVARHIVLRLDRKYTHLAVPGAHWDSLVRLREGLDASRSGFLLGSFSYADITMATLLEAVVPTSSPDVLGPAQRRCWTDAALAEEFPDLIEWRNRLIASFRTF